MDPGIIVALIAAGAAAVGALVTGILALVKAGGVERRTSVLVERVKHSQQLAERRFDILYEAHGDLLRIVETQQDALERTEPGWDSLDVNVGTFREITRWVQRVKPLLPVSAVDAVDRLAWRVAELTDLARREKAKQGSVSTEDLVATATDEQVPYIMKMSSPGTDLSVSQTSEALVGTHVAGVFQLLEGEIRALAIPGQEGTHR